MNWFNIYFKLQKMFSHDFNIVNFNCEHAWKCINQRWNSLHIRELVKHCLFVSDEGCIWWENICLVGVVCYYSNCHYDIMTSPKHSESLAWGNVAIVTCQSDEVHHVLFLNNSLDEQIQWHFTWRADIIKADLLPCCVCVCACVNN